MILLTNLLVGILIVRFDFLSNRLDESGEIPMNEDGFNWISTSNRNNNKKFSFRFYYGLLAIAIEHNYHRNVIK